MVDQAEIHRMARSEDVDERKRAVQEIQENIAILPKKDRKQAWECLIQLIKDREFDIQFEAEFALASAFSLFPFKEQIREDLHQLAREKNWKVRSHAPNLLASFFPYSIDKELIYQDLIQLTKDKNSYVRENATAALGLVFYYIPNKGKAWKDLHRMTKDKSNEVLWKVAGAIGINYQDIPNKEQAWNDLHKLTLHKDFGVRWEVAYYIGEVYPYILDKKQAWSDLILLADEEKSGVCQPANYSLGRASINKASKAKNKRSFENELRNALKFFKASMWDESASYSSDFQFADFCLPFYSAFFGLISKKYYSETEVMKYLEEAKRVVEGSESKEKLLEAVENLGNALKEVQKARDFNEMKSDLNAYRRYCDRACELLDITEDIAPGASRLIRRGLPIIDERIKGIIAEIQEKAGALCKETRGTAFESLGKDLNNAGQNLLNVRDPIGLEKQVQNMLIVLKSICTSMPEEEKEDACEFLKKANDEHYVEDKLSSINMVLSKIPTHIRKAIVMTNIEIKNSTNTQVAVGNGNIQKIITSSKPEYGLEEPEKLRKIKKSVLSIDEKIWQNNASIEQILDSWSFRPGHGKRDEKKADIKKWLHRFQLSEFEDAFLILERIQYHDSHTVDGYMEGLSGELKKIFDNDLSEILFYPLGESPASSGGNLLYSYRKDLGLPESSFPYVSLKDIDLTGKKAIVFFDDIIGSGNQAVRFAKNHLKDIKVDKYYVALMAFEKGLENVRNNGCFKKVIVHEIISEELRAFSLGSQVFPDADTRERIKILCEKYGKLLYPKHPLGYDDSQALIVFPHNTPNNTLPIIWASDKNEKEPGYVWYPIWERKKRTEKKNKRR